MLQIGTTEYRRWFIASSWPRWWLWKDCTTSFLQADDGCDSDRDGKLDHNLMKRCTTDTWEVEIGRKRALSPGWSDVTRTTPLQWLKCFPHLHICKAGRGGAAWYITQRQALIVDRNYLSEVVCVPTGSMKSAWRYMCMIYFEFTLLVNRFFR